MKTYHNVTSAVNDTISVPVAIKFRSALVASEEIGLFVTVSTLPRKDERFVCQKIFFNFFDILFDFFLQNVLQLFEQTLQLSDVFLALFYLLTLLSIDFSRIDISFQPSPQHSSLSLFSTTIYTFLF